VEVTSGAGAVISIVALFAFLVDSISVGAKTIWFLALTCRARVAIPIYFVLRPRRRRDLPRVERSLA
jgi:hypothetical protein